MSAWLCDQRLIIAAARAFHVHRSLSEAALMKTRKFKKAAAGQPRDFIFIRLGDVGNEVSSVARIVFVLLVDMT